MWKPYLLAISSASDVTRDQINMATAFDWRTFGVVPSFHPTDMWNLTAELTDMSGLVLCGEQWFRIDVTLFSFEVL
jgi:hypothetical protein